VAAITGGVLGAVTRSEASDRVTLLVTEERDARAVHVMDLDLTLSDTPPGSYLLTVTVRDLHDGSTFVRSASLRVRD
jgi:hypothetical protein